MTSSRITLADGSPIPNYLTQSSRTPLTLGKIQTLGELIYGYSGMVNFDVTAAASYNLINFVVEKTALFKMTFAYDGDVADIANAGVGVVVNCDGLDIFRAVNDRRLLVNPVSEVPLLIPANKATIISVLNPNATAALIQANVTLVGQYV
jgi:hypothetical protein